MVAHRYKVLYEVFCAGLVVLGLTSCKARSTDAPLPAETEVVSLAQPEAPGDTPSTWVQKSLQEKVVEEATDKGYEVFGLFSLGGWQVDDGQYVVTVDNAAGTADLHYYAPLQTTASIHKLTVEQLAEFRTAAEAFDSQDDYNPTAPIDGFRYNYLHFLTGQPTARLFMKAPDVSIKTKGYMDLLQAFRRLPRK